MQLFSYVNIHKINRLVRLRDELQEIYTNQVVQTLAMSLIGIFIPIYLLEIGFSTYMVFNYYAVFSVSIIAFSFITARISTRIGLKHAILVSTFPLIIQYVLLEVLGHYKNLAIFYTIPILQGLWSSLYWLSLHSEFVKNSHKIHEGSEIGNLIAFPKIAATLGPFFGAVMLKSMGFDVLFVLVIFLIMFSVIPLFFTSDSKRRFHFRMKDRMLLLGNRVHFYLLAEGMYLLTEVIVWPVFVYLTFRDLMPIGILATVSSAGIILFTFVAGKLANKGVNKRKLIKVGGVVYGTSLIFRPFVSQLYEVYILSFLGGIASTMILVSVYARFCDEARSRNIIAANIARHFWLSAGKLIPLFLVLYFFGFEAAMIAAGIAIMGLLLI
jgi:hypothetical protein